MIATWPASRSVTAKKSSQSRLCCGAVGRFSGGMALQSQTWTGKLSTFKDNIGAAFIDMSNGNLDAVLNDFPTTQAYISKHGTAKTVGEKLSTEYYGIAVRKSDNELLGQLNKALEEFKAGDGYAELHVKWFGVPPPDGLSLDTLSGGESQ